MSRQFVVKPFMFLQQAFLFIGSVLSWSSHSIKFQKQLLLLVFYSVFWSTYPCPCVFISIWVKWWHYHPINFINHFRNRRILSIFRQHLSREWANIFLWESWLVGCRKMVDFIKRNATFYLNLWVHYPQYHYSTSFIKFEIDMANQLWGI